MSSLTHIVSWSQMLACEILRHGDLAIDLTAGKGRDTYALAKAVGPTGQVVAFDLQNVALEQTALFLQGHNLAVYHSSGGQILAEQPGIYLVRACHGTLGKVLLHPARVIMANLGYLPAGDQSFITQPRTTLDALQQSLPLLVPGGRLVVTVYPAHAGGVEEEAVVKDFFSSLPVDRWQVLSLRIANCSVAPGLLVAERTCKDDE